MDVLCSDKTGTLTAEQADAGRSVHASNGIPADQVILWAALASRAEDKDTIDLAVIGGVKDDAGVEGLPGRPFPALRSGAQAHRGHGQGDATARQFYVAKGAPQVILADVDQRRRGEARRREGGQRIRRARLPFAGRGAGRSGGPVAVRRRAAAVRSAARGGEGHHRERPADGREGQDGDRRSAGHRPGNGPATGAGHEHPRRQRLGRHEASRDGASRRRPSNRPTASPRSFPSTSSTSSMSCSSAATSSA